MRAIAWRGCCASGSRRRAPPRDAVSGRSASFSVGDGGRRATGSFGVEKESDKWRGPLIRMDS
jgi:hypothetical protein